MARKSKLGLFTILFALLSVLFFMQTAQAKQLTADQAQTRTWTSIYYYPGASLDSGRVIPPGTIVSVDYLDRTANWAYISSVDYGKGWIRRSSIHFVATENYDQETAENGQAYSGMETTTTRWGSLHTAAPYRSTPIALAPNMTVKLQFSSVEGNWAYVTTAKGDGWLPLSQLKVSSLDGLPLWR